MLIFLFVFIVYVMYTYCICINRFFVKIIIIIKIFKLELVILKIMDFSFEIGFVNLKNK